MAGFPQVCLPELLEHFASHLPTNNAACSFRLVNKATAAALRGRKEYTTVRLSQPVPAHAFAEHWTRPGALRALMRKQRFELLRLTAASGSTANLAVALDSAGLSLTDALKAGMLKAAAGAGRLEMCERLLQQGYRASLLDAAEVAAAAGQQAVLELLLASGVDWNDNLVFHAARGGHVGLVNWLLLRDPEGPLGLKGDLHPLGTRLVDSILCGAAKGCCLTTLKSFYQRTRNARADKGPPADWPAHGPECVSDMIWLAAHSPTADWRDKVEWLESLLPRGARKETLPGAVCWKAAACPDALSRVQWLRQRGYAVTDRCCGVAAESGEVAVLAFLLGEGFDLHPSYAKWAARGGHVQVLQLLHGAGCEIEVREVIEAATHAGQLSVLRWAEAALGAGCVRAYARPRLTSPDTPFQATSVSVELLAWLRELLGGAWSGSGWQGSTAFEAAADVGCEEVLEWMAADGCDMGTDGAPYLRAAINGDLATLRCLARLGCPWGPPGRVFMAAASQDEPKPLLRCLIEAGCPIDWQVAAEAAQARRHEPGLPYVPPHLRDWLLERAQEHSPHRVRQTRERRVRQTRERQERLERPKRSGKGQE